ncbi:MAG TPA: hypothetical protein VK741_25795 [Acetobacteraceae bacterium]|jgi:hypothetical protein|nr:hypothetical protein [Acetobacteraceae bacterium]
MPVEFECRGCGWHIVSFVQDPAAPELCLTCRFIESVQDPEERTRLRDALLSVPPDPPPEQRGVA